MGNLPVGIRPSLVRLLRCMKCIASHWQLNNAAIPWRRLDLNLLLVFDALYRHRNVGTAASELAISASAFSR